MYYNWHHDQAVYITIGDKGGMVQCREDVLVGIDERRVNTDTWLESPRFDTDGEKTVLHMESRMMLAMLLEHRR